LNGRDGADISQLASCRASPAWPKAVDYGNEVMAAVGRVLIMILLAALIGGAAYLMFWDIPAPRQPVEVTVPNDRLPQ
jgi:hypothetical protein